MTIHIEALSFQCIIGLLDFERTTPQTLRVDATIDYPYTKDNFIDYAIVVETIKTHLIESKYELLEDALQNLEALLLEHYPNIEKLTLKLSKPDILEDCIVGVSTTLQT